MMILIILGIITLILGFLGCFLPVLPGPPLSFVGIILLQIAKNRTAFSMTAIVTWGLITLVVTILDTIVPVAGAKKFGASKSGIWGSVIGLLLGMIFFPPWGMIIGTFFGAIAGELLAGKQSKEAFKAGLGTFLGTMLGLGLKLAASIGMAIHFIWALLKS
jgi:uncharacterized protein